MNRPWYRLSFSASVPALVGLVTACVAAWGRVHAAEVPLPSVTLRQVTGERRNADLAPAHGRPFFMPAEERARLRQLIATQEWAKEDYARLQDAARRGNGHVAAFLHALDGGSDYAPIAQKWLLEQFGKNSGKVNSARAALNNPNYFKGGMPHLGSVYYDTDFTDYAAVAFGPQTDMPEYVLEASADGNTRVAFKSYGYLRVRKDGTAVARGGWTGFSIPAAKGPLTLNGQPVQATEAGAYLTYGTVPPAPQTAPVVIECPFPITFTPEVVRLAREGRRTMTMTLRNTLSQAVTGRLEIDLPGGVTTDPTAPHFGPVEPGATAQVPITLVAGKEAPQGKRLIPYRVSYRTAGAGRAIRTAALPLSLAVGTTLNVAAAELAFPGGRWNLAFAFDPLQPVTFNGTELRFPIGCLTGDAWSVGFCKPGELDTWRKRH